MSGTKEYSWSSELENHSVLQKVQETACRKLEEAFEIWIFPLGEADQKSWNWCYTNYIYRLSRGLTVFRDVKLIFTGGHISLAIAFKELNVILGLYKCNYSSTIKQELSAVAG